MKKFVEKSKNIMKKQTVMIVFVVLALFFTALYIGVLARPISYGMEYSMTQTIESPYSDPVTITSSLTILNGEKASTKLKSGSSEMVAETWILISGNKVAIIGAVGDGSNGTLTREQYDSYVASLNEDPEQWNTLWSSDQVATINAFTMGDGVDNMTCNGAIAFAVVMGLVTVISIVMAGFSISLYVKDKKTVKTIENAENQDKDLEQGAN